MAIDSECNGIVRDADSTSHYLDGVAAGIAMGRANSQVASGTEGRVCEDLAARQALGIRKYGVTVELNPLDLERWLQHAYEECLDQAVYLRRSIEELRRYKDDNK